ncbi:MAG: 3-deoxy-7-phosphoheptulonate synthase [Kiritimatiellae bacterium]|nr:3-deoxy-7-phosphoheptulonate synthase [Kiritimatiellia bacterium]
MHRNTDDLRIAALNPLIPPAILMEEAPISDEGSETVASTRRAIGRCLRGEDQRLVAVVGPCSMHDPKAAVEYAGLLHEQASRLADELLIVMRVYFEKPRTSVGWKGLINDPFIDGSFKINKGLRMARGLLCELADMGLPAGCEFLDTIMPQFLADLVSWGAIGARTTESQVHRELASGMSCPVGFKNATNGNVQVAVDAIEAARHPHHFLSVTKQSVAAIVSTRGNEDCHVIMRGGEKPNYDAQSLAAASALLEKNGLHPRLMVDCSHGNSEKDAANQPVVGTALADRIAAGDDTVFGVMIESNLVEGRQDVVAGQPLVYGQSITDACLGWDNTVTLLETLAAAVRKRA